MRELFREAEIRARRLSVSGKHTKAVIFFFHCSCTNTSREFQKMPRFVAAVPLLVAVTGCLIQQVHAAEFKRNAAGIEITGEVVPGDDARFKSIISTMPAGGFIYLESPGGSALTAIAIGRLIRARGLNTSITAGTCASACGIIWLAGVRRHIGPTGKVGFHAAYNGVTLEQSGFANALIGAYLNGSSVESVGNVWLR
jgi:hypothetical protein